MRRVLATPKRAASTAVLLVGGGALSVATWLSGEHGFAVALAVFYVVAGVVAYVVSGGSSDVAAIMRTDGDERQRSIDHEATRVAGIAMGTVALAASVMLVARGEDPGGFLWTCTVGGVSYTVAIAVLRRRR